MRSGLGTGLATVLLCLRRAALLRPGPAVIAGSPMAATRRASKRSPAPLAVAPKRRRSSGGVPETDPSTAASLLEPAAATAPTSIDSNRKASRNVAARKRSEGVKATTGATVATSSADGDLLFALEDLVPGTLLARPSRRNRSPFVADLRLERPAPPREVLVHVPNLDMCGQCGPGAALLVRPLRDAAGRAVGPDAVSAKYGTPRCEFTAQLLRAEDQSGVDAENATIDPVGAPRHVPTWVAAHPALGERVAEAWLKRGLVLPDLPPILEIRRQFTLPCEDGTAMRPDFLTVHEDGTRCLVEVKTVVDTDYARLEDVPASFKPKKNLLAVRKPYVRTAIFPNGSNKQKGPDGEAVVSSRAIKHIQELTRIVQRSQDAKHRSDDSTESYEALVLFCVVRGDAEAFRPNHVACPSFAKYLQEARDHGVRVVAKRTRWDETGRCFSDKDLPIQWPE